MARKKQVDTNRTNAKVGKKSRTPAANTHVAEAMPEGLRHENAVSGDHQSDCVKLEQEKSGSGESVQNQAIPVSAKTCIAESGTENPDVHRQVMPQRASYLRGPEARYVARSVNWPYK